jgi:hypothetical protein
LVAHGFKKIIQGTWIPKFIMARIGYTTSDFGSFPKEKKCGM